MIPQQEHNDVDQALNLAVSLFLFFDFVNTKVFKSCSVLK